MPVAALDILIAHKVINLSTSLSNSDKRVAGILLDHFNRRTMRCDPSLETLADFASMSRRTIMRSVLRLERQGFFRKVRHGGQHHRNMYEPIWPAFCAAEDQWKLRRKLRRGAQAAPKVSPLPRHHCHPDGDSNALQTCPNNLSQVTLAAPSDHIEAATDSGQGCKRSGEEANRQKLDQSRECYRRPNAVSSRVASRDAAERRWNNDLLLAYSDKPELLGRVVDAIDAGMMVSATDTELRHTGSGLAYLISELQARDIVLRDCPTAAAPAAEHKGTGS